MVISAEAASSAAWARSSNFRRARRAVVAAVLHDRACRCAFVAGVVRHLCWFDQIATPDRGGVDSKLHRQTIHHALDDKVADLASPAANEAGWDGVGINDGRLSIERRQ